MKQNIIIPQQDGVIVLENGIAVANNGKVTVYKSFNELIDTIEPNVRLYLQQKDNKKKELLASMKKEREELAMRLKGLDADIKGMERETPSTPCGDEDIFGE